ncbi:MAG: IPT/TIG domain-containing protein [Deltaproteobacteria bacterium]|nr:IPT/TIG domain-containing protein [Deltaproteobacteria bacterium]
MRIAPLAAIVLSGLAAGCPQPQVADAGPADAAPVFDSGLDAALRFDIALGDLGPAEAGEIYIDDIINARTGNNTGDTNGGYRVRITGSGFNNDVKVFFGEHEADNLLLQNSYSITVRVPATDHSGPVDVRADNGARQYTLPSGFIYFDPLAIDTLSPSAIPVSGGTRVTMTGSGFPSDTSGHDRLLVLCGGRTAADVMIAADDRLEFTAPPGSPGLTDVVVLSSYGRAEKPLGLLYYEPLQILQAAPMSGPLAGGTLVEIQGSGFSDASRVAFGARAAAETTYLDRTRLRARAPAASAAGAVDIVVDDDLTSATLIGGFAYLSEPGSDLRLDAVVPAVGDSAGGETVVLVGDRLDQGAATVTFGVTPAVVIAADDGQHLRVHTPAHAAGAVDVVVVNTAGAVTRTAAFTYQTRLRVSAIDPVSGSAAGGTAVTVTGVDFSSSTVVHLGGVPLLQASVVDATTITGTTPPGSAGPVDVTAVDPERGRSTLAGGYRYLAELSLLGVDPVRGGMSGGTFARLYGSGFSNGSAPAIAFGLMTATGAVVESDNLITLRTPPNLPGVVDVKATRLGVSATAERAFTYFDPGSLMGGARGGPIDGAVYVSCYNGITGMPEEGITVLLGTRADTPYVGRTDEFGQATLSGPDVRGPQTVTAAAAGFQSMTMVEVNAAQISLFMIPTTMTPSSGQPPPLPPAPVISGRVFGFAKELFDPAALGPDESPLAVVDTTMRSIFSSAAYPEASQYVVSEGGEYEIPAARPGRLAVVAVAGIYNVTSGDFRLRQIGFHRGVTAAYGDVLEDIDVELTIPFNTDLTVTLPGLPFGYPYPDTSVVLPFINLGGEGAYALPQRIEYGATSFRFEDFPDVPGELLSFIAGAFTLASDPYTGETYLSTPYSVVVRDGVGDLRSGLVLDPILGFPQRIEPTDNGVMYGNRLRWRTAPGTVPSFYDIYLAGFDGIYWEILVPGTLTKVVLPVFPDLAVENPPQNLGLGAYQGYLQATYVPGFSFDSFSYLDLSTLAWRSWTQEEFRFVNSNTP